MGRLLRLAALLSLFFQAATLSSFDIRNPEVRLEGAWLNGELFTDGRFPLRVIGAIDDGIRIRIIFEFRLVRKNSFFLSSDTVIFTGRFSWSITRNLLEGTYVVQGSDRTTFAFRTRREYLKKISGKSGFRLLRFSALKTGAVYYLEGRVLVRSTKMYPPFSLLSVFSRDTEWKRSGVIIP